MSLNSLKALESMTTHKHKNRYVNLQIRPQFYFDTDGLEKVSFLLLPLT